MKKFVVKYKNDRVETVEAEFIQLIGGNCLDAGGIERRGDKGEGTLTFYGKRVGDHIVNGPFRGIALSGIAEWEEMDVEKPPSFPEFVKDNIDKFVPPKKTD